MVTLKTKDNRADADRIRQLVFLDEQQFSSEFSQDDDHFKYITLYLDGECVGCVRYKVEGHKGILGRLAVLKSYRGLGYGKVLVSATEEALKNEKIKEIHLHAQEPKISFYQSLGYESYGEFEMDEYMPHVWMKKELNHE